MEGGWTVTMIEQTLRQRLGQPLCAYPSTKLRTCFEHLGMSGPTTQGRESPSPSPIKRPLRISA